MSCTRRSMVFLLLTSAAFAAQWTPVSAGLTGSIPAVSALVIDRSIGSTLYAVTSLAPLRLSAEASSIFNVFKSTDGGTSWKALADIAGVNVLAIDPISASTIYAGTAGGVFKSTNGGDSWETNLSGTSISVLAIDPITPSNLYAAGDKFYKSTDAGASWTAVTVGPGAAPLGGAGSLTLDPLTPSTLYVVAGGIPPYVLYKSTDEGQSWRVVSSGVGLLAIAPTTPSTLYATLDASSGSPGFSKSADGGATWTQIGFPRCVGLSALAIDPTNPNTMYGASGTNPCDQMPPAIFKSTDGGQSWNAVDTIIPAAASFVFSPGSSTIYAATVSGVFKSTDGGSNWGETNTGLRVFDIEVLVGDPINPATIYAGGNDGLFKSVDGGANWTRAYTLLGANSLLINFRNSNILYARKASPNGCSSIEIDLHKSTDGGSSWNELEPDAGYGCGDGGTMAMDPVDPNTLYVVYGNDYDGFTIFKTTDGGTHWVNLYSDALGSPDQINALVIDPNTPATLYAPTDIGVFRSTDGGASFTLAGFANTRVLLLAIDPVRSNVLYAATSNNDWAGAPAFLGLYKSTDSGASWSPINQGLDEIVGAHPPVNALLVDADRPNILYLATSGYGVFKSSDGGATWAAFNNGLTNLDVRSLALVRPGMTNRGRRPVALSPDTLYAGTPGGVFKIW